jgi:hypothetical protein
LDVRRAKGAMVRNRGLVVIATTAVFALVASPALAATSTTVSARTASATARVSTALVDYLAGYSAGSTAPAYSVTATFVVPRISCGFTNEAFVPTVGVYYGYHAVTAAGLFIGCSGGSARYWPTLDLNQASGARKFNTGTSNAYPGDTVVLLAQETGQRAYVSVVDRTRHFTRSWSGAGRNKLNSPWIGDSTWATSGGNKPIPAFDVDGLDGGPHLRAVAP